MTNGPAATTDDTRAVVSDYFDALGRGDLDALRASFAPDATWWMNGSLPVSGTWTGADGILDGMLARVVARLDPSAPVTQTRMTLIADGDTAAVEWTSHARSAAGQRYDNHYAAIIRVHNGLITEVREYFDTAYMQRILFADPGRITS